MGIDRPGDDLPGYPIVLPSADPNLCWKLCNDTKACSAYVHITAMPSTFILYLILILLLLIYRWAYGVPSSSCETQPKCWLKSAYAGTDSNSCRASGAKGIPAGPGRYTTILIN
jgi:hypothetical protein